MSRVTCTRCSVGYDPSLTGHRCPVCDAAAPGFEDRVHPERDRLLTVVLVAAVLNVVLLLGIAVAVAHAA